MWFVFFLLVIVVVLVVVNTNKARTKDTIEMMQLKSQMDSKSDSEKQAEQMDKIAETLVKLQNLKEQGILTEEEFNEQKKKFLNY